MQSVSRDPKYIKTNQFIIGNKKQKKEVASKLFKIITWIVMFKTFL